MTENSKLLTLSDRRQLDVSGVREVVGFDERGATLITENGELCVEGENIRIANLDAQRCEVRITGRIDAIIYTDEDAGKKKGLRAKLFG
jgi:sporulation protein YabP